MPCRRNGNRAQGVVEVDAIKRLSAKISSTPPRVLSREWQLDRYVEVYRAWEKGCSAEQIATGMCVGRRKIAELVTQFNKERGTKGSWARTVARREDTAAAWFLKSVKSRLDGDKLGRSRMMNKRELNRYIESERGWDGTSYWATVRDVKALGLRAGVVRNTRSRLLRNGKLGKGVVGLKEWLLEAVIGRCGASRQRPVNRRSGTILKK